MTLGGGIRALLAVLCAVATAWGVWLYPLPAWPLAAALVLYAAALRRWPVLAFVVVPAVLPSVNLGMWTGWLVVGEPDLVILVTVAVLLCGEPVRRVDLRPWAILSPLIVSLSIGTAIGFLAPANGDVVSANPYLRPDNAARLVKPFVEMLALLPFLSQRDRLHGDLARWIGRGMAAGAVAVAAETVAERALFPGIFDFSSDYRVTALFFSMHIGGGHIGAYLAMMLPFLFGIGLTARRWYAWPVLLAAAAATGYALIVTFARTAYAAGVMSLLTTAGAWLVLPRRRAGAPSRRWLALMLVAPVVAALVIAMSSGFMRERFSQSASDLFVRETNWRDGWAIRDQDALSVAFGMGLGTFPRLMAARGTGDRPSDYRLEGSPGDRFLTISAGTKIYIGQKIRFAPSQRLRLTLRWRAGGPSAVLGLSICEKVLLYSQNCRDLTIAPRDPGQWEDAAADIPAAGLTADGWFDRPVEFSLYSPGAGTTIAVRDLSLVDDRGQPVLANGDFRQGMARWAFTDDSHLGWRMKNLYLMLLFETGLVGLLTFAYMALLAIDGSIRAARRGDVMGAVVIGSVTAFLISGLFDNVLELPPLAAVFLLVCATGLMLRQRNE